MSSLKKYTHPRDEIMRTMERIYRYRMTTTSGGNSDVDGLGQALRMIQAGGGDLMLGGGTDCEVVPEVLAGLFAAAAPGDGGSAARTPRSGRGIGLAIVHDLMTGMGGLIRCRSGVNGTVFDVLLPHRQPDDGAVPEVLPP